MPRRPPSKPYTGYLAKRIPDLFWAQEKLESLPVGTDQPLVRSLRDPERAGYRAARLLSMIRECWLAVIAA